jgi:hypothetical protein
VKIISPPNDEELMEEKKHAKYKMTITHKATGSDSNLIVKFIHIDFKIQHCEQTDDSFIGSWNVSLS